MTAHGNHSSKPLQLSAISTFTREDVERVDQLTLDGRCNLVTSQSDQPGGLGYHASKAVRTFDPHVRLAWGSLIGIGDRSEVLSSLRALDLDTSYLLPVPDKPTNRSQVFLGRLDQKLIIRRTAQISFEADLDHLHRLKLREMVALSDACLLGNLSLALTADLIEHARDAGTYMVLVAGSKQLGYLAELRPHALTLNGSEGRQAALLSDAAKSEDVFERLLATTRADHVVVMTGGGRDPTFVADRFQNKLWRLEPDDLSGLKPVDGFLNTLGAGDTLAGALAFLLGRRQSPPRGDSVREAVHFAQTVVSAHLTDHPRARTRVTDRYRTIRSRFEPKVPVSI
jgi:sugar/nucleoside kinase (ribokinase family)